MLIVQNPERPRPKSVNLHVHVLSGPTQVFESISMNFFHCKTGAKNDFSLAYIL